MRWKTCAVKTPKFNVKCIGTERVLNIGIRMVETKATSI